MIETQIERCRAIVDQHRWNLADTYHNSAVSGTSYKRPGRHSSVATTCGARRD